MKEIKMVFTGSKEYTTKKLRSLHGRGWVIVRSYAHADGKFTYVMEYKGKR
jgi:hypothetical protein